MTEKTHLPCPFCGDKDIRFRFDTGGGWVAECGSCPCELRWFSDEQQARDIWNKRPVVPAETEPQSCTESDGCPTELAVLQRFWRSKNALLAPHNPYELGLAPREA